MGPRHCRPPRARRCATAFSRGGDRQVNNAIHTIALSRSMHHPETRAYLDRRISEGKTKREAMRALKRHLSRILFKRFAGVPLTS